MNKPFTVTDNMAAIDIRRLGNCLFACDFCAVPRFDETAAIIVGSCLDNMYVDSVKELQCAKT